MNHSLPFSQEQLSETPKQSTFRTIPWKKLINGNTELGSQKSVANVISDQLCNSTHVSLSAVLYHVNTLLFTCL